MSRSSLTVSARLVHGTVSRSRQLARVLRRVHQDEAGSVSLETILIIGAIALPILIFSIKFGWPRIRGYFNEGIEQLQHETSKVTDGS